MSSSPRSPGAGFNSSALVRGLAALAPAASGHGAGPAQPVAEALSQWLAWTDAIALSGVLQAGPATLPAITADAAARRAERTRTLAADAERLRRALTRAIQQPPGADSAIEPAAASGAPAPVDFAPYRRHYAAHQRAMAERIGPLRAQVRAALAAASPALRRLAALDAVLDEALDARSRHLLGTVPGLLEAHFQRTRQDAAPSGALLHTVQQVLLAELETRWQPIEALMQALAQDAPRQP